MANMIIDWNLQELIAEEQAKKAVDPSYIMREFEILEWVTFEVFPDEASLDPATLPEQKQRKYFGTTVWEFKFIENFEWIPWEGEEIQTFTQTNPFTGEIRQINRLVKIPPQTTEERISELKQKVVHGTITTEEKEELKLLTL